MSTLKILVVDDEPGIRSGITRILRNFRVDYPFMDEAFEFDVIEAPTGEAGIEIIESNEPDILLLDNKLPGTNCLDTDFLFCPLTNESFTRINPYFLQITS